MNKFSFSACDKGQKNHAWDFKIPTYIVMILEKRNLFVAGFETFRRLQVAFYCRVIFRTSTTRS